MRLATVPIPTTKLRAILQRLRFIQTMVHIITIGRLWRISPLLPLHKHLCKGLNRIVFLEREVKRQLTFSQTSWESSQIMFMLTPSLPLSRLGTGQNSIRTTKLSQTLKGTMKLHMTTTPMKSQKVLMAGFSLYRTARISWTQFQSTYH